jgi:hypothetical protein
MPPKDIGTFDISEVTIVDQESGEMFRIFGDGVVFNNEKDFAIELSNYDTEFSKKFLLNREATIEADIDFASSGYKTYKALGIYDSLDLNIKIELFIKHLFWKLFKK